MVLELVRTKAPELSVLDVVTEANHRIANNLSIISGLVRKRCAALRTEPRVMSAHEVGLILDEVGSRLEGVARLHRLLAGGGREASVDATEYLRDIAEEIVSSLSIAGWTELQFESDRGCSVPAAMALPLGLIAAELVTNAIKYAHPAGVAGRIKLHVAEAQAAI